MSNRCTVTNPFLNFIIKYFHQKPIIDVRNYKEYHDLIQIIAINQMRTTMNNHDNTPKYIQIRGARVHNLKNINADIPLHQIVGIAPLSQWTLCGTDVKSGCRAEDYLSGLCGTGTAAECGRTGI